MVKEEQGRILAENSKLDFGMRTPAGNAALRDILTSLIDNVEERPCPCWVLEIIDDFCFEDADGPLPEGAEPADPEEVREYFLKHYRDLSGLELCEGDICERPDGVDCSSELNNGFIDDE